MQWPRLAADLVEEPNLLDQIASGSSRPMLKGIEKWRANEELRKAVNVDAQYSLSGVDVRPLLMIMPDARPGIVSDDVSERGRTRLIARVDMADVAEANVTPTQNTSSRSERGPIGSQFDRGPPTGATGPSVAGPSGDASGAPKLA